MERRSTRRESPSSRRAASASGPPWILGLRGAPREAPENTLSSLRRAVELGLDGLAYEVRACASGELVLLADATLDRTTDARGALATRLLAELYGVDAGGWFGKPFAGEPLALLDEALALEGDEPGTRPQHLIEVREPGLLGEIARMLKNEGERLSVRVASPLRSVCVEARDLGLSPLLVVAQASEEVRRFVRDERITACAAPVRAWSAAERGEAWDCERFALGVDEPDELLAACRAPLNALTTSEPARALAIRALVRGTPSDTGPYPLRVPELVIEPDAALASEAQWCGTWSLRARVRNPFDVAAKVTVELVVRRGAFESQGLPREFEIAPRAEIEFEFQLTGGAWSPGGDPLLVARFDLGGGAGVEFDATLHRVRSVALRDTALRLPLLAESPREPAASVNVRRSGRDLLVALENAGDLLDARLVVDLDGAQVHAPKGVRLRLPEDFERRPGGVPFAVGLEGRRERAGRWRSAWRRWSGGLPNTIDAGSAGRLYFAPRS
jgi:hypothetical protein